MAVETGAPAPTASEPAGVVAGAAGFRPGTGGWIVRGLVLAIPAFAVLIWPIFLSSTRAEAFAGAVVFAIIALSLNVLIGYTGQISLGHQAFVGIGAFTSAYVVTVQGQPFVVGVAVAAAIGGVQALVLGVIALRITGLYFALITLAYGVLAQDSLFNIEFLTGGGAGQRAPRPTGENFNAYYYLCLLFLFAVLWVDWRMMRTKGGRALLALRENPRVAATFGVNVKLFTLFGFIVAGVFAGIGGALLAHRDGFVVSDIFTFELALLFIIMTVVGGLRSRAGVIIGAAFFALIREVIEVTPGLETAMRRWEITLPVLALVPAVVIGTRLLRAGRTESPRQPNPMVLGVAGGLALAALVVLSPARVPVIEGALEAIPTLTPEIARLVLGPTLLLVVLTLLPGGVGQLIRPIQHWLRGNRWDPGAGAVKEVQVTDVRA